MTALARIVSLLIVLFYLPACQYLEPEKLHENPKQKSERKEIVQPGTTSNQETLLKPLI